MSTQKFLKIKKGRPKRINFLQQHPESPQRWHGLYCLTSSRPFQRLNCTSFLSATKCLLYLGQPTILIQRCHLLHRQSKLLTNLFAWVPIESSPHQRADKEFLDTVVSHLAARDSSVKLSSYHLM